MRVDQEAIEKRVEFSPRERYVLLEADGEPIGYSGLYNQRPAALRHAAPGYAVYDRREKVLIKEADPRVRIERIEQNIVRLNEDLVEAEQLLVRVQRAAAE